MNKIARIAAVAAGLLAALGPLPVPAAAVTPEVSAMMADFRPVIASLPGEAPFLIAAGPFFDPATRAREPLCQDIEAQVFDELMKQFAGSARAVIVDWKRSAPLPPAEDGPSGVVRYRLSGAFRKFLEAPGRGFLITGFADAAGGGFRLRGELVAIADGRIAAGFGPPMSPAVQAASMAATEHAGMTATPAPASEAPRVPAAASSTRAAVAAMPEAVPAPIERKGSAPKEAPRQADAVVLSSTVIEGKNFRYEGQVNAKGEKHGHGALTFAGGDRYEGQWQNNRMNGEGTYRFADGDKYIGQWRDSKMHGRGTYVYAGGDKYSGQFADDVKDGPGTYHFTNGDRWEGSYLKGKKHGKALYIWKDGQTKQEFWDQGQKVQ